MSATRTRTRAGDVVGDLPSVPAPVIEELNDFLDDRGWDRWEITYDVTITYSTSVTVSGCDDPEESAREEAARQMREYHADLDFDLDVTHDNKDD